MQLCGSLNILWHWLSWGLEWKLPFSSPVATAEFSKFAGILSAALSQHHLLEFGIPSPPLALFIMMLPKAHLTLPSRMCSSRWVFTPSWLSRSWRSFLYSSVYSCHLFLRSSASAPSILWWDDSVSRCRLLTLLSGAGKETFITLLFLMGKNIWFYGTQLQDVSQVSMVLVDKRKLARSEERRDLSWNKNDNCIQLLKFFLSFARQVSSFYYRKQYKQYHGLITHIY